MSAYSRMARTRAYSRYGYQGDPGLGGFLKKAAGVAMNFLPGGGIAKTVGGIILGGIAGNAAGKMGQQQIMLPSRPGVGAAPPLMVGPVGINLPYAGPPGVGIQVAGQHLGITPAQQSGGMIPRGYRLNKSGYYTKDGYVEPYSKVVRVRRRNPLNPRAADRAISRLESAKKATKRLSRISIRKASCCK